MKKIIFLAFILIASVTCFAVETRQSEPQSVVSTNTINGKVIDKETKEGLAGVAVVANGQKLYTDFDGNFTIKNLCGSNCELTISLISYETQTLAINLSNTKTLDVSLKQL